MSMTMAGRLGVRLLLWGVLLGAGAGMAQELTVDSAALGDKQQARQLQQQLIDLSFLSGKADGAFGKASRAAFGKFLAHYGPERPFALDAESVALLGSTHAALTTPPWQTPSADFGMLERGQEFTWDGRTLDPRCADPKCSVATFLLTSGDLNGDGRPELVYGSFYNDPYGKQLDREAPLIIYSPDAEGKFTPLAVTTDQPDGVRRKHMRLAEIADFNGDGVNDLFVAAHGYDYPPFKGEQNILLLSSPGGLVDVSRSNIPLQSDFAHGVDSADLDGDGDLDMIVITNNGAARIESYVLWNDGTGKFTAAGLDTILDRELALYMAPGIKSWSKYVGIAITDLDDDGHPDLVLQGSGDDAARRPSYSGMTRTRVAFGDGSGRWSMENTVELPVDRWGDATHTPFALPLDIDGDGDKDLVLSVAYSASKTDWAGSFYQVLRNDGGRRFTDTTATALFPQGFDPLEAFWAPRLSAADLNGDGIDDIVATAEDAWRFPASEAKRRTVRIMIGDGKGHFARANPQQWGGKIWEGQGLGAGDFDGDGDIDIAGIWPTGEPQRDGGFLFSGFAATIYENQGKPVHPPLTAAVDMPAEGATSTRQQASLFDGGSSEINTLFRTEILSGDKPGGLGIFAFNIAGRYASNRGDFFELRLVIHTPAIGKRDMAALSKCRSDAVDTWDDGSSHLAIHFVRRGTVWAARSGDCILGAAPADTAAVARYVIDNLAALASDLVASGEVDQVSNDNLKAWIGIVAAGEVSLEAAM